MGTNNINTQERAPHLRTLFAFDCLSNFSDPFEKSDKFVSTSNFDLNRDLNTIKLLNEHRFSLFFY